MKIISIFLFIVSCSNYTYRDVKIDSKNFNFQVQNETLSPMQISEDLRLLEYILKNSYVGYFHKNHTRIDEILRKLNSIKDPMEMKTFCEKLAKNLSSIKDEHLTVFFGEKPCLKSKLIGNVGTRQHHDQKKIWTVETLPLKKKILLITISKFASFGSPIWDGFLEKVEKNLKIADFVLLDMRGNGGGDDSIGWKLAELLVGNKKISSPYGHQYKVVTRSGLETRWNRFRLKSKFSKSLREKVFLYDYVKKDKRIFSNRRGKTIKMDSTLTNINKRKALKPIYILQDKACASSCESTIDFFEYIYPVTKIGENTAGYVHFGNLGTAQLKNSKIMLSVPSTFNEYRDGRFIEGEGITPDIRVKRGQDAFHIALNKILEKKYDE